MNAAASMRSVTIVGASLAGVSAARALRAQGFDGKITVVGDEPNEPYDRPPLSKGFLDGTVREPELGLLGSSDTALDVQWVLGKSVVGLDARAKSLRLFDGTNIKSDGVVIATGATARGLNQRALRSVHTLRSLADAEALRSEFQPGRRLVVIGGGFIGTEVATVAARLGLDVTVVQRGTLPLRRTFGGDLAAGLASRYAQQGIALHANVQVESINGPGAVTSVTLSNGMVIPTDTVLIAVGSIANDAWLQGSAVQLGNGVVCDAGGGTSVPGVVAAGDCASWFDVQSRKYVRDEHWTAAVETAGIAVERLLGRKQTALPDRLAPYLWSDQLGVRFQLAGELIDSQLHVVHGDDPRTTEMWEADAPSSCLLAERHGRIVGVLGIDASRHFGRWRRQIGNQLSADDVLVH